MPERLDPAVKISMIESFAPTVISILIGFAIGLLAGPLGWGTAMIVFMAVALNILMWVTPVARLAQAFARRKAESYYYGT